MKPNEEQVETAFIEFLKKDTSYEPIGRQVSMPIGRLDVLAYSSTKREKKLLIAEVKRGKIDEYACTQLLGYMRQLDVAIESKIIGYLDNFNDSPRCFGVLVGTELTPMVERIINTFTMSFCKYWVEDGIIKFDWNFEPYDADAYLKIYDSEYYSPEIERAADLAVAGFYESAFADFVNSLNCFSKSKN